ncbi:hypothetical protein FSP39_000245 [Pinctada imbricata]|uniref:Uncharacterized protein n=1 Tax=Pinctada imbricata TaxID=66713 RepID=A0AA89BL84_PINIB|nr:hypothetical protein FSP39_000245 [Pinctada imbricata]
MNSSYDFRSWKVPDLSNYLKERGISVSLRRKNEIVRLCELANELQLEVISSNNDFQDMDISRRTVLNGEEKVVVDDISTIIDWATSLSNLPDIDFCDIFLYLMNSCKWDDERLKNYKNDNGHRLFLGRHIDNVQLSGIQQDHYIYIRATCVPETRQSAAPYNVWLLLKDSGEISSGGCSCVV